MAERVQLRIFRPEQEPLLPPRPTTLLSPDADTHDALTVARLEPIVGRDPDVLRAVMEVIREEREIARDRERLFQSMRECWRDQV